MMNESYLPDADFGLELQSLDSYENKNERRRGPRIVLTMPAEWLDPKQPLPTDKEFHRWVSEQLRARRNGRQPMHHDDNLSVGSAQSNRSQRSAASIGRAIKEASSNLFGGILRKRRNRRDQESEQRNLLQEDCFADRDNGVVGMELSVLS